MAFKPLNTKDETTSFRKTLLYASHGWGKTTQAKHYKRHYGKGFIISGEAGLSSIRAEGIDYLPFTSFDGPVDEAAGIYSFVSICKMIMSPEFKAQGYKWIMLDSLTELSDMVFAWADAKAAANAAATGKKQNGFEVWGDYKDKMIGACKFIRDLPYHVIITALAKTTEDDNGDAQHIPLLQGNAVQAQVPGIFDNVLCGVSKMIKNEAGINESKRFVVTAAYAGWQGKVRDESGSILPVEETGDITSILLKMDVAKK
jgi:hypothetical protein